MFKIQGLQVKLHNTIIADTWKELHDDLNIAHDEVLNDSGLDKENFRDSIQKANNLFGFNWPLYPNTQKEFNRMHKDIRKNHNIRGLYWCVSPVTYPEHLCISRLSEPDKTQLMEWIKRYDHLIVGSQQHYIKNILNSGK